jgi:hypothetical protein
LRKRCTNRAHDKEKYNETFSKYSFFHKAFYYFTIFFPTAPLPVLTFITTFYTLEMLFYYSLFMKKIISSFLLLTLLASGCNLFKKSPQEAVNDGMNRLAEVKQMSSKLVMSGTVQAPAGELPSKVTFSLDATGKNDMSDAKSPKFDMKLSLSAAADSFSGSGEVLVRSVDKKIYVNVANLNIPGELGETLKTQLGSLFSTWFFIPLGDENPIGKLTEEQKELQEKFKETKFFVNAKEDGEEEVAGIASTRYRVDLDKEALKSFVLSIARVSGNQPTPEEEKAIGESLKDVEFSGAVWVGSDKSIHRVRGTVTIQPAAGPSASFEVDYSAWDFGKDVAVSAPEGAQEFNPLMMLPILGAFGGLGGNPAPIDQPLGAGQVRE